MLKFLLTLVFFATLISNFCLAAQNTITLVADEWPPFNSTPDSEKEGYIVDVARKVFESQGYEVIYKIMPWKRAIQMTRSGEYDGAIGASKTDAAGFVFPVEELAQNKLAFYVKKGETWRYNGHESITATTIGTIAGYDYRPWLLEYIETNKNNPAKVQVLYGDEPLRRNLGKLLAGKIKVVVDTEAAIRHISEEMKIQDQIECAGYGDEPAMIYIAFSPSKQESADYARILSEGIIELRKTGELHKILSKYGLQDWK